MKRRAFLAVAAGAGTVGLAGCLGGGTGGTGSESGSGSGSGSGSAEALATVDTIDAPGSTAGRQRVPAAGTPTFVDLFATWCAPCRAQMRSLVPVHESYRDRVTFVSITNERFGGGLTAADVADWWREHDGAWTVGHDPDSTVMRELRAGGLPYAALFDARGEVVWTHRGLAAESTMREEIEAVLA
jgi:thiol-disulfide isomerase/thioredoxin